MRQEKIREDIKFIIDSVSRTNQNLEVMLKSSELHSTTITLIDALKSYLGPLGDHLLLVHNDIIMEFSQSNVENGRLREALKKHCECGALELNAQCEGCELLEELEKCEQK